MMVIFRSFWLSAQWGARAEAPPALADRFLLTIDALRPLNPLLDTWIWCNVPEARASDLATGSYPLGQIRSCIVPQIEANVSRAEEGALPDPDYGYLLLAMTDRTSTEGTASLSVGAGSGLSGVAHAFKNHASFDIGPEPDPSLTTYAVLRAALLVIAETWEATWAEASPDDIRPEWSGHPFRCAWMSYLSPRLAPRVTPPASAIVEYRPNGGLFLAATNETFATANPKHLVVAREIEAALRPLNDLAFPTDDPYQ